MARPVRPGRLRTLLVLLVLAGSPFPSPADGQDLITIDPNPPPPPRPEDAREAAQRAMQGVEDLVQRIEEARRERAALSERRSEIESARLALEKERDQMLADMRGGLYCSQCHRSRTEIEAAGEGFYEHLRNVRGIALPAPDSLVRAKAAEYQEKIEELSRQAREVGGKIAEQDRAIAEASAQVQEGVNLWRTAITFERELIASRNQDLAQIESLRTEEIREVLRALQSQGSRGPELQSPEQRAQYEAAMHALREMLQKQEQDAGLRARLAQHDVAVAASTAQQEFTRMSELISRVNPPDFVFSPSIPRVSIPIGPVTLSASPDALGAKFRFGGLASGGVRAGRVDAVTTESRAFLEVLGRFQVGVGYREQYGVDGFTAGYFGYFRAVPTRGPQAPGVPENPSYERRVPLP